MTKPDDYERGYGDGFKAAEKALAAKQPKPLTVKDIKQMTPAQVTARQAEVDAVLEATR